MMDQWWVHAAYFQGGWTYVAAWIFWVLLSISLHELAHGWAALWQGDETPRELGHMTWNPWVHMGPWSLGMFALIGIAWGMMPTRPNRYRWGRRGQIVVAAAGPAMNIVLALITLSLLALVLQVGPSEGLFAARLKMFLYTGGWLNVILAGLNLLPVPPLDGSRILSGLSEHCHRWFENPAFRQYSFFAVLAIFWFTPLGGMAIGLADTVSLAWVELLGGRLAPPA